jgi:hypothetical protein
MERMRDKEIYETPRKLMTTFFHRMDGYAVQNPDGSYYYVQKPITPQIMLSHLEGMITLGTYILDKDNTAKFCVIDGDDNDSYQRLYEASIYLDREGNPTYFEDSRRGGHLWMFFEQPVPGRIARNFGLEVAKFYKINAEVFPKQAESSGPGSCIRVPFGVHRKSGERYPFLDIGNWTKQIRTLSDPEEIPIKIIYERQYKEVKPKRKLHMIDGDLPLWEKVKQSISVYDLVSGCIDLKKTGSGAVGICPFHDDVKPSFGVNIEKNYWYCFAGCGGGSVIDFWMKFNDVDFETAVRQLAEMMV